MNHRMCSRRHLAYWVVFLAIAPTGGLAQQLPKQEKQVTINHLDDRLVIQVGGQDFAHYVFRDENIPRPYFAHVKTPSGLPITRTHPPVEGKDATDHATMHPGIWLAFGDLDGDDFWRNKASIRHVKFVETPRGGKGSASFVEEKRYVAADGREICTELFRCRLHALDGGFLMEWDSSFSGNREFFFGDQEEMGLGVRVATPLAENNGGQLRDSEGRRNSRQIWSNAARWCDYSGAVNDRRMGVTILSHPDNFRVSWMHARNYGFMAANAFGRKAMKKGDASKLVIKAGESLPLRYGIWIHESEGDRDIDLETVYRKYVTLTR